MPSLRSVGARVRVADIVIERHCEEGVALQLANAERDLRLLALENEDRPDDTFTLFNLGLTCWAWLDRHENKIFVSAALLNDATVALLTGPASCRSINIFSPQIPSAQSEGNLRRKNVEEEVARY